MKRCRVDNDIDPICVFDTSPPLFSCDVASRLIREGKGREDCEWWQDDGKPYLKDKLKKAFDAGCAYTVSSHEMFKQIHPNFDEWYESNKKELEG